MDIETRIENLEQLVNSLIKTINQNKYYTDADMDGVRQSVGSITPATITKTAYIDDESVEFENVPEGNLSIYLSDPSVEYRVDREQNKVTVNFDPLTEVIEVTISIL